MTAIYHITHLQNLRSIIAGGQLFADSGIRAAGLAPTNIAHGHIKDRRARTAIPVPPHGMVADYVPFYLCPRSPMLYVVSRGGIQGYPGGQAQVLHLVAEAEDVSGLTPCVHTDGNAATLPLRAFPGTSGFGELAWDIIRSQNWADTANDNDRKRRKQAEFLAWRAVPWTAIRLIGVRDDAVAAEVRAILAQVGPHHPTVEIHPDWYY